MNLHQIDEQAALLAVVASGLMATFQWPVFDYVDRMLYKEFRYDARSILNRLRGSHSTIHAFRTVGFSSMAVSSSSRSQKIGSG